GVAVVVARVLCGPVAETVFGNHWAGAPSTPANTCFQTPLVQPSGTLSLTSHCCCEPLTMVLPVNCKSAMKPPLANAGPVQNSISVANPLTWTRRIGAACETAQNSPCWQPGGLDTVMVRF